MRIIAQIQINCERATRLLGQRYDVYSKYHKVGNSFNLLKYTHKNKPVVCQKQTKNGFKNNININKDNFTNLLATFFVKVQLKTSTNERNFSIFCRCFACDYAGCSHPTTGQIFKHKTWLFIGSRNFCRVQEIARANEQPSFMFKNLSSSRMRASRIVTSKTSAKYRKISFICGLFKLYFDKKSCQQVSKIILVYIYVVFKAVFCLLLTNYGFICVCVFQKVERVANLMIFTIYVISLPEQSSRTFAIICI